MCSLCAAQKRYRLVIVTCPMIVEVQFPLSISRFAARSAKMRNREARITPSGNPGFNHGSLVSDACRQERCYALKELPQPHVVFACGFLMENPEPWTLST